jgi:hypothetical protein
MTNEELTERLVEALVRARHAEPDEPDPDYPQHNTGRDAADEHGVKQWLR